MPSSSVPHLLVNPVHPRDRCLRLVTMGEGCDRDEARRAPQPPLHILAEIRMIEDALQRVGVEHLQQQRTDAADHHRDDIGMD